MSKAAELAKMGEVLTNSQVGGRRNIFINGAMQVSERATSFAFAHDGTTNAYTLDRWQWQMHNTDELDGTITQDSDAPNGFKNSYKWATGTAESAIATDEFVAFRQNVEAQDLQQLKYGTADAETLTISFYVKSSVTGTYGLSLYKPDQTARSNNKTYTIDSANTWEFKTVTFPADTGGGGIDNDTGNGMSVYWVLASGATYDGTNSSGAWINNSTASFFGGHVQDGVITTASATWLITGVQMEVGSTATPFEHRSFGEEKRLCQRYYQQETLSWQIGVEGTRNTLLPFPHKVSMRSAPTATLTGGSATNGTLLGTSNVTSETTGLHAWYGGSGSLQNAVFSGYTFKADSEI